MKNKFEALSTFQSWPEDWQRLCAEYWAESNPGIRDSAEKRLSEILNAEVVKKSIIPWTTIEEEYLAKCWEDSGRHRTIAARLFLEKHPGRSLNAVCRHIWDMKAADGHLVIRY